MMCTAASSAEFYVYKIQNINNNQVRWNMMDKLNPGIVELGYDIDRDPGDMRRLAEDLVGGLVSVNQLLGKLDPSEVYGGEFIKQPITSAHKEVLSQHHG